MITFFSGKVGTARLFFFVGFAILVVTIVVGVCGYYDLIQKDAATIGASLLGALGFVSMISGGIQISMICENGSPHDFH